MCVCVWPCTCRSASRLVVSRAPGAVFWPVQNVMVLSPEGTPLVISAIGEPSLDTKVSIGFGPSACLLSGSRGEPKRR